MTRVLSYGFVVVALAGAAQAGPVQLPNQTPTSGQSAGMRLDRTLWWQDDAIKKEIGLRDDQAKRVDALYAKRARELEPLTQEFEKQRAELNRLMADRSAGAAAIELQVARMELPRARINESYFSMLYRMYLVLDAEQNRRLQVIFERQRGRGRGGQPLDSTGREN